MTFIAIEDNSTQRASRTTPPAPSAAPPRLGDQAKPPNRCAPCIAIVVHATDRARAYVCRGGVRPTQGADSTLGAAVPHQGGHTGERILATLALHYPVAHPVAYALRQAGPGGEADAARPSPR